MHCKLVIMHKLYEIISRTKHFKCRNWTPVPTRRADRIVYSRIEYIIKICKIGMILMREIFPCDELVCRGTQKKATGKCTLHTYSWLRMPLMNAQRCLSDIDILVVRVWNRRQSVACNWRRSKQAVWHQLTQKWSAILSANFPIVLCHARVMLGTNIVRTSGNLDLCYNRLLQKFCDNKSTQTENLW